MSTILSWKNNFLSSTYSINMGNERVGELRNNSFKQKAVGILFKQKYRFETLNIFHQSTVVIDDKTGVEIGSIVYNIWHTKATVTLFKKQYDWQYNNIWNTKWSLYDKNALVLDNNGTLSSGKIESSDGDPLLILASLYVTNYYWQSTAVVLISLLPIYLVLFT